MSADFRGFTADLTALITRYGLEGAAETPAALLAYYVVACLNAYTATTTQRTHYLRVGWQVPAVTAREEPHL